MKRMRIKINNYFRIFLIFCNYYWFVNTFIGHNIKHSKKDQFPFIVALMRIDNTNSNEEAKHLCTGTMITRRDVAIAEHCLRNEVIDGLQIMAGSIDLRKGRKYSIYWWITYEHWAVRKRLRLEFSVNDVGNLRLSDKVHKSVKPVKIANKANEKLYNKTVQVLGWGWFNESYIDRILKVVDLKVLTNDQCVARISQVAGQNLPVDPRHALCTVGEPHTLLTYGTSGGPVLYKNKIVGINQGASPNTVEETDPQLVNLHMSFQYYKQFFLEVMNDVEN